MIIIVAAVCGHCGNQYELHRCTAGSWLMFGSIKWRCTVCARVLAVTVRPAHDADAN